MKDLQAELIELRTEFELTAGEVDFNLRGVSIVYDVKQQELIVNGHRASAPLRNGRQRLTVFVDRTGLEVFASDGLTYVPMPVNVKPDNRSLNVSVKGGSLKLESLEVHELRSIWK